MPKETTPKETKIFCLYEWDNEIAAAFKRDCEEFLEEYERLESLSYDDFAKVWRRLNFTYVFAGQRYALILKELCENYYYIVKKYIVFPKSIYTQVGAFYMLYGLYYKQPIKTWVKIRLTLEEYNKITKLIELLKTHQMNDAAYIFAKMKMDQAFIYTALRKPLGPEDRFIKSFQLYYDDTFRSAKTESALTKFQEIMPNSELIEDLQKTNSEYQKKIKKYSENCPTFAPFVSTIIEDLRAAYTEFQEGTSNLKNKGLREETIQSVTRTIKDKAMANKNAVYRGARKVKTAVDDDLLNDIISNKK